MAVIAHIVISGMSRDQYDATRAKVGWLETPPDGSKCHLTWWDGAECHFIDVWEDEEAFAKFGEDRLGPAMAALEVEAKVQPTFHSAYEVFAPNAITLLASERSRFGVTCSQRLRVQHEPIDCRALFDIRQRSWDSKSRASNQIAVVIRY